MENVRYSLELLEPLDAALSRRQLDQGRWRIGRGGDCDVRIDARGVSREHVEIEIFGDGGCALRDLGSTNGSRLDGRRFQTIACVGDAVLDLGGVRLRLHEHRDAPTGFAFRTGHELPESVSPTGSYGTHLSTLGACLRDALWRELKPAQSTVFDWLPRIVAAWASALELGALHLTDRDGVVFAAAGAAESLVPIVETGNWRVLTDADSASQHPVLASVLAPLLEFLPLAEPAASPGEGTMVDPPGVPSRNRELVRRLRALQRVARTRVHVLVLGETGVGKEALARWVHDLSPRHAGPFVAINCGALPRDLLDAELFGIERGAATGVEARAGVFERAHGGTLFLDELGDMPPETQVRLLRTVEEGRILRIGGKRLIDVDVRLVGATHRDLSAEVASGRFRLDLYHRLSGFEIEIPPLRERREDIAPLAFHFFARALADNRLRSPGMTSAALSALQAHPWPGNVRELKQAIEAATAMLHDGEALDHLHLPERVRGAMLRASPSDQTPDPSGDESLAAQVARAECQALRAAIARHGHGEAAWIALGIGKTSFYKKLREHGLIGSRAQQS